MNDFDFWYAYFDSLFLKPKPIPLFSFTKTINFHEQVKHLFPQCRKLPQLSNFFEQFQQFIFSEGTWIESQCEQSVLKEAENNFNLIAILINAEKKYGQDFWHYKRRIQASVCHFFALFVYFIFCLFPKNDSRQTLESLKSANKLFISLKALEELVNKMLQQMNGIIEFLYQESFAQEKKLTIKMLKEIRQILLNLPTLNKSKFKHQFQLSKYLYVIIPIQLSNSQYKFKIKKKKTLTISKDIQFKYHSDETVSNSTKKQQKECLKENSKRLSFQKMSQKAIQIKFRTKVVKRFPSKDKSIGQQSIEFNSNVQKSIPTIFKFSQKLRKYSFYLAQKKITKSTLQTHQTLQSRYFIQKSRKISDFGNTSSSPSKQKNFSRNDSIQKPRNLTSEAIRSKKSSFQKTHRENIIEQSENFRHDKQKKIAKSKRKNQFTMNQILSKPVNQIPRERIPSKNVNIFTGDSKGWGVIQEEINKKIAVKKIYQLIHSKEVG